MSKKSAVYYIPYKFRRIENLHILLWLIKDACWALNLKIPAMVMIVPTLMVAMIITYQTRKITSEFLHNLSIIFWIVANCTWMVGEFYGWDANLVGPYGLREFALVPFGIGLLILAYYYLLLVNRKDFEEQVLQQTERVIQEQEAQTIK
jgi:predicted membrane-bound dolichyl-phosphate-mannose-protein mannosyltransferase